MLNLSDPDNSDQFGSPESYNSSSVPSHVQYEVDASENNFDEKVTALNLKDSDSDNSGSDAGREKEVMREL